LGKKSGLTKTDFSSRFSVDGPFAPFAPFAGSFASFAVKDFDLSREQWSQNL
jgi:hypothetical protein